MAQMKYKTKNNSDPKGKPKVYFTCHPDDKELYFEKLWEIISASHNVAMYYTEDMTEAFDDGDLDTDLGQMNLFVVPVTKRLLTEPCRAMDVDIAYAEKEKIPILPLMMESGLDELYSHPDKFGSRHYLAPFSDDTTAIRYPKKLKKFLESVLISDEMAKRIRAAFDAHIFLSYRKKDRRYAHELMKLIHNDPECWDIAIWYDEFLSPGESFWDGIQKALNDSDLFALLITPTLLEYTDGKPNFVIREEYPAALKAKKPILPAELLPTDHGALSESFEGLPDCIDPHDSAALKELLLQAIHKVAISANDRDSEHNFLLGLAYLDGIEVEANRQRGIDLITLASDADLTEAMKKLYSIYKEGNGTTANFENAIKLAERIYKKAVKQYGKKHPVSIDALCELADIRKRNLLIDDARGITAELYNKAYKLTEKVYGKKDPRLIDILLDQADLYDHGIINKDSLHYLEKAYEMQREVLGEDHTDTVDTLQRIARFYTYETLFENKIKAVALWEQLYALQCRLYGEDSKCARKSGKELTALREGMSAKQAEVIACDKEYRALSEALGENDTKTVDALSKLATAYEQASEYEKAEELHKTVYARLRSTLGKDHADPVAAKRRLAHTYEAQGDSKKALRLYKQIYSQQCRILGRNAPEISDHLIDISKVYVQSGAFIKMALFIERHLDLLIRSGAQVNEKVLESARMLPSIYMTLHMNKKAERSADRIYELHRNTLGDIHTDTVEALIVLCNMCCMHKAANIEKKAYTALESTYARVCEKRGATCSEVANMLSTLISHYEEQGLHQQAIALLEERCSEFLDKFGIDDPKTANELSNLAYYCQKAGMYLKAGELYGEVWKAQNRHLGPHHEDTKYTFTSLEDCLEELKGDPDYGALLEIYKDIKAQLPDEEDLDARLEEVYKADEAGDHEKAATLLETLYQYAVDAGDEEDLNAVAMLESIVTRYKKANNPNKVAEIYQRIYDLRCELQGTEHVDTLASKHELAYAHFELFNRKKALRLFNEVYDARCKVLGEEHPDTLMSKHYLAFAYYRAQERRKALELFEQTYASRCKVLGAEHADTLFTLRRVGTLNESVAMMVREEDPEESLSRFRKAKELYEQAYTSMRKVLGEGQEEALSILRCLGAVYKEFDDYQKAADAYGQEFASRCKVFGEEDHETSAPLSLQADAYAEMGEHRRSAELFSLLYSVYYKQKGADSWYTQDALKSTAEQCSLAGDHQTAIELYEEYYAVYLESSGEDEWETQQALKLLTEEKEKTASSDAPKLDKVHTDLFAKAFKANSSGDLGAALPLYAKTYEFRCEVLGSEHPLTLSALAELAAANAEAGNGKDARELYERLYTAACKVFGTEHKRTQSALQQLQKAKED